MDREVVSSTEAGRATSVTVVVCAFSDERLDDLTAAVTGVLSQLAAQDELVVVIDHNESLLATARRRWPSVKVIPNSASRGLSGARNTGVAVAVGDAVLFLDDDAAPAAGWVQAYRRRFSDPRVMIVGGAVEPSWDGGRAPNWFPGEFGWVVGCDYIGLPPNGSSIRNPIGASMGVRRSALDRVGAFSEDLGRVGTLPAGCEETEMGIRIRAAFPDGLTVRDTDAVVAHRVRRSRQRVSYFLKRCYHEGRSKAKLSSAVGAADGLSAERRYVVHALTSGLGRNAGAALRGNVDAAARALMLGLGFAATVTGYVQVAAAPKRRRRPPAPAPTGRLAAAPLPASHAEGFLPVPMAELEWSEPPLQTRPNAHGELWVLVRAHKVPLGALLLRGLDPDDPTGAVISAVRENLGDSIREHFESDGLPFVDGWPSEQDMKQVSCARRGPVPTDLVTVVLCTLGREPKLAEAVAAVLNQDYPALEVVVVDNAPDDGGVRRALANVHDTRLRIVPEASRGLSHARNAGLAAAGGQIVAFTDDDALPDTAWIRNIATTFAEHPRVSCVTGLVIPAELAEPEQVWFEEFGSFNKGYRRVLWQVGQLDDDVSALGQAGVAGPIFPYSAGEFGSGNNMAFRTGELRAAGGFDVALGAGTLSRGGEDLDAFVRVLLDGGLIVYEPSALVRHHHRADLESLRTQMYGYGSGMSAMIAKQFLAGPHSAVQVLANVPAGLKRLLSPTSDKNIGKSNEFPRELTLIEWRGFAAGPVNYLRGRRQARRLSTSAPQPGPGAGDPQSAGTAKLRGQDHAQQPLLRRLVRRVAEPSLEHGARIRLVDVELSTPLRALTDLDADSARILVSAHGLPLGIVELPVREGTVSESTLRDAIGSELGEEMSEHLAFDGLETFDRADGASSLPPRCIQDLEPSAPAPLVTVVIPTRDRAAQLAVCLRSMQDLCYPSFEVIVVDNAPSNQATQELVNLLAASDPRIRYLVEPIAGASRARNLGTAAGRGEIVAFTDDDVVVDRRWLSALVAGFGDDPSVDVVGGLTVPGHLDTPAQRAFELYGGMGRGYRRRLYDLDENRGDTLLYPYTPGIFGASNNVAFRRRRFLARGGFDLALGPASPAYSAEDLDAFLAVILAGQKIVYEPRAVVRHEHRREFADLYWQVFTYSAGSSALLTKWALKDSSVARELVRRVPPLLPAALVRAQRSGAEAGVGAYPSQLRWLERAGYLYGPIAYFRARSWARRQARRSAAEVG